MHVLLDANVMDAVIYSIHLTWPKEAGISIII